MSSIQRQNHFRPGDLVTTIDRHGNGTGEGIIWEVTQAKSVFIWIRPVYTVTGRSVLRPKKLHYSGAQRFGLVELGLAFQEFHALILKHFQVKSGALEPSKKGFPSVYEGNPIQPENPPEGQ